MNNKSGKKIPSLPRLIISSLALLTAAGAGAQPVFETPVFNSFSAVNPTPAGNLVLGADDGVLYGTGNGPTAGTNFIFRVNRDGSAFQVLNIVAGRAFPGISIYRIEISVLLGSDGFLYGNTPIGGSNGAGTIYKMGRDGTAFTVLHSFSAADGTPTRLMQAADGTLYGVGVASIFSLDTTGDNYTVLHTNTAASDGTSPLGVLLQAADGMLYGTMNSGGSNSAGTIFKINTNGGGFQVLHSFPAGVNDGMNPVGGLIQGGDGALYGTTYNGGTNTFGTVYKITTDGSSYTELYSFSNAPDGKNPAAGLVLGIDGALYGTTQIGGTNGALSNEGTIFKIALDGSGYRKLYDFGSTNGDGAFPNAAIVRGPTSDGTVIFYGTTSQNVGQQTYGTVFALAVNPPMSITPAAYPTSGNQVTLFWPAWAQGAVLQSTTNLTSGSWASVTNGLLVTGVQVTNAGPNVYYRLTWPP